MKNPIFKIKIIQKLTVKLHTFSSATRLYHGSEIRQDIGVMRNKIKQDIAHFVWKWIC